MIFIFNWDTYTGPYLYKQIITFSCKNFHDMLCKKKNIPALFSLGRVDAATEAVVDGVGAMNSDMIGFG